MWTSSNLDQAGSELTVTGLAVVDSLTALLTTETPFGPVQEERGEVFRSVNQGQSWTRESLTYQFLHAVGARDGVAWAVGKYGRMSRSLNAGDTWNDVTPPILAELRAIAFPTEDHGVVMRIADAQLSIPYTRQWITDDGGETFDEDLFNLGDVLEVTDISAVDENLVYAAVYGPTTFDIAAGVRKSNDGGTTWSFVIGSSCPPGGPCPIPYRFTAIDMVADGTGFACNRIGRVYRFFASDDTASVDVTGGTALNGIAALDATAAVTVGDNGFIARTSNGGVNWTPLVSGTGNDLRSAAFSPSGSAGLVVGESATVLRSVDGGATWDPVVIGGAMDFDDVVFVSDDVAVISAEGGVAHVSDDGGETWLPEQISVQLNDVTALASTGTGVYAVVAHRGIAYRGFDIASAAPAPRRDTVLGQNIPNPFNPVTEIPFTLARGGYVDMMIYDVRGGVVASVLSRTLPAGAHRARWDGRNHKGEPAGSGVYFYRLRTGGSVFTRKMVLLNQRPNMYSAPTMKEKWVRSLTIEK
jgi:photosystem II stability/assembly factor-like uncharacterized protein